MSSQSIHCPYCHSRVDLLPHCNKNVNACMKAVDRGSSPLKLISSCISCDRQAIRTMQNQPSCDTCDERNSCCPFHGHVRHGHRVAVPQPDNCLDPPPECSNCKCSQTLSHSPPSRTNLNSGRRDPDPLE